MQIDVRRFLQGAADDWPSTIRCVTTQLILLCEYCSRPAFCFCAAVLWRLHVS